MPFCEYDVYSTMTVTVKHQQCDDSTVYGVNGEAGHNDLFPILKCCSGFP